MKLFQLLGYTALMCVVAGGCAGGGCEEPLTGHTGVIDLKVSVANASAVTSADVRIADKYRINGVSFADVSAPTPVKLSFPTKIELFGHGETTPLWTGSTPGNLSGVVFVLGSPLAPFCVYRDLAGSTDPDDTILTVVLGDWQDAAQYDVYITVDGASLASAVPMATKLAFDATGNTTFRAWRSVTPGKVYNVSLCQPGTKNVVQNLGAVGTPTFPIELSKNYFLVTTRFGGAATQQLFVIGRS